MKIESKKTKAIILFSLALTIFSACQKDETAPSDATNANTTPIFEGSAGVLWAVRTSTTVNTGGFGGITIDVGTGVGVFMDGDKYVDAGTVKLNGQELSKMSNNSYVSTASLTQPTGIDFSDGIKWDISGGNGFAAFSHTNTNTFPTAIGFTCPETLNKANGFTMSLTNVSGADSIIFMVNDVLKTLPGNTKSYTFSAEQLSKLSKGPGVAEIVPYNYKIVNYGGKNIVFGNELALTQTITIN